MKSKKDKSQLIKLANTKVKINVDEMEVKDVRTLNFIFAFGLYLFNIVNVTVIIEKGDLMEVAIYTIGIFSINLIVYLVANVISPMKAYYSFGLIHLDLAIFSMYLCFSLYLDINSQILKIIYIGSYFIVQFVILIMRLVVKNDKYIKNVLNDTHGKYRLVDLIISCIITLVLFAIGKALDNSFQVWGNIDKVAFVVAIMCPAVSTGIAIQRTKYRYIDFDNIKKGQQHKLF